MLTPVKIKINVALLIYNNVMYNTLYNHVYGLHFVNNLLLFIFWLIKYDNS